MLASKPQLTTDSDGSVGSAPITVSGAASDDYAISYHAGVLSVVIDEPSFDISPTVGSPLAGDAPTYSVVIVSVIDGKRSPTVQVRMSLKLSLPPVCRGRRSPLAACPCA